MKRVIFVKPQIENPKLIFDIFKKHNPDSSFVNPHICLVFPFESNLETRIIESIINDVLSKYISFTIQLSGLSVSYEKRNNFLFLNVIDELNILKQMSSDLYNCLGDNAKLKGQYTPHITIAKSKSVEEIDQVNKDTQTLLQPIYNATISTIYCKKLIKDSNGNIKLEDEIEFELPHNH
jgi:2'-5' RNA ligase